MTEERGWITDRRPTEDDADGNGNVLVSTKGLGDSVVFWRWQHVASCSAAWMTPPKPYQPPEPDTSLSASIERIENSDWSGEYFDSELFSHDHSRVLEAARKWDAMANKGKCVQGFDADDIGESEQCLDEIVRESEKLGLYGTKWEAGRNRSDAGESPALPTNTDDEPKRREWWLNPTTHRVYDYDPGECYGVHVREVLPGDPDPEWVDELIRLCEKYATGGLWTFHQGILNHLAKRGEK